MSTNSVRLAAVLISLGMLAATACQRSDEVEPVQNDAADVALPLPPLPVAEPPMDRSALLLAAARAGSAAALGRDDSEEQRRLDGKRFEVRIRFGCAARTKPPAEATESAQAPPFNVRFDEEERTLRVRAAPDLTLTDPPIAALAGEKVEAVEGFWMYRPWLLAAGCPVVQAPPKPAADGADAPKSQEPAASPASPPSPRLRVGIAQFYSATDPRTGRRDGRAYEATEVLKADEQLSSQGYDLVLLGRLRRFANGRVILCRSTNIDSPPECVISADFDRVRIEAPGSGTVLAEWTS